MFCRDDYYFMSRALALAKKGYYTTDPNPNVGCVLVKQGKIIAEGWHAKAGREHAEIVALQNAGETQAATAYVTLEPCNHQGKTPPCCDALIEAGIRRVVVAMQDPNPLVAGSGLQRLRAAGMDVECGILEQDANALNCGFVKRMQTGLPWVISKMAMSLDGRTAMASGESRWITSPQARQDVHRLRARSSAIMTGIATVLADDCALTARLPADIDVVQPIRVVLDSTLQMPLDAKMLSLPGRTLILACLDNAEKKQALQQCGAEVFILPADENQRVDLYAAMKLLGQCPINQVLIEAGPTLNGALLKSGLVDEWVVYMAPSLLGDGGRGLFKMPQLHCMADKIELSVRQIRAVGPDIRLTWRIGE